jgi:hypothetical protein
MPQLSMIHQPKKLYSLVCLVSLLSFGAINGCGSNNDLASVTGKITLDGQPLADAAVVFSPTSAGTTSYGRTDSSGNYVMMFSDSEKGAWIGENLVRISTGDVGVGGDQGKKETVPSVYNVSSTLRKTVEKKANRFDFELMSSAGKVKQTIVE